MKAALTTRYGSPDVLEIHDVPTPAPGPDQLLVDVYASPVSAGDRRLRAADFPGFTKLFGRPLVGLTAPRQPSQGSMFSGVVAAVGSNVTGFAVGDRVFGASMAGAWAERLVIDANRGAVAHVPDGITHAEAAAVPYGAGTALHFLDTLADVRPGDRVLILGASGGVGRYAIQLAKHRGAHVTAVASAHNEALVRSLGADEVVDYRREAVLDRDETWQVVFDTASTVGFTDVRRSLSDDGRFVTLTMTLAGLFWMAWTALFGGRRALTGVAIDDRVRDVADLLDRGVFRPHVVETHTLDHIVEAHRLAESGINGEVVVLPRPTQQARADIAV
jgi:NADPH:quinone reductase-like Zn-dependent oxidoreductase